MRVAIAAESFLPSVNGVTNSVLRVAEHLRLRGHEAIILAPHAPSGVPGSYAGFPVIPTPSVTLPWYPDLRLSTTIKKVVKQALRDFRPDVVHAAAPMLLGRKAIRSAAKMGIPSVALFQTEVASYVNAYGYGMGAQSLVWHHMRTTHQRAALTLAPSSYTRDELIAGGFERVHLWGRGVDTQRFSPTHRDQALHDSWAGDGRIVVGYMGRLSAEKQVHDLHVLSDLPGISLVIIGDGPQREALEHHLDAHFTGMLAGEDLARHVASLDIFVHPGELETFGQAIQEAQASGLPTIAPAKGGPVDLITPGVNGYLYTPGDLHSLRAHVARLVADENERTRMGAQARAGVEDRTWPVICDQLIDYYHRAIADGVPEPQ